MIKIVADTWSRSRLRIIAAATLFQFAINASASWLAPGQTVSLRFANEPVGATLLAFTNCTFQTPDFSGTLNSKVWAHDQSNPWGGLTFTYQLGNHSECADALGRFTLGGFSGLLTDVGYSGFGIAPRSATRSASGAAITFSFFNGDGEETLRAGLTSAWLVIQTSALTWGGISEVQLETTNVQIATFGPALVPEPAAPVILLLGGMVMLGYYRVKR